MSEVCSTVDFYSSVGISADGAVYLMNGGVGVGMGVEEASSSANMIDVQ